MIMMTMAAMLAAQAGLPEPRGEIAWELVGGEPGHQVHIDPASPLWRRDIVTVRIRADLSEPQGDEAWAIIIVEFDCRARSATNLWVQTHDQAGRTLMTWEVPPADRVAQPVGAGVPIGLATLERGCRR